MKSSWKDLHSKWPEQFSCSQSQAETWHRQQADSCTQAGNWLGAITQLDGLIGLEPAQAELYARRGRARAAVNKWQGAVDDFSTAIALKTGDNDVWFQRGRALGRLNQLEGSVQDLARRRMP